MLTPESRKYTGTVGAGLERKRSWSQRLHVDMPLLFALTVLLGFGLLVLYSATNQSMVEVKRQLIFIGIAYLMMFGVAQFDVRWLRQWSPWMFLGGVLLLLAVLKFGEVSKGARRWLDFPGLPRFQPSEVMKILVPLTVASFLSRKLMPPKFAHILICLAIIAVPAGLTAKQPDLGTALLIGVAGMFVILLAGMNWKWVGIALLIGMLAAPALWIFYMDDYQKNRIHTFLDPEREPLGAGWNIIQSKTAIGSGGINGKGWLNGVQSRLDYLPEGKTDFIVAVLAEEFGLVGMLFLLTLYIVIIGRALYIAGVAQDLFSRLLAGSLALTFFVYVFVNIGMVSGLLPVVGVPLPLVSLGGTSIISLMTGFGILMSIHTHRSARLVF
ncbi:MAG TPA: rod shape-determining protein RodA [Candidatus Acidoferrum sp.]|nr:rod shape-determining protein RodA [Candidatus Acidoferrum sp.]